MKKKTIIPYVFLILLMLIAAFAGGVRYGRKVAETSSAIEMFLSITPTRAVTVPPVPTTGYTRYVHDDCGVAFLLPSDVGSPRESSTGALLSRGQDTVVRIECARAASIPLSDEAGATVSARIAGRPIVASESAGIEGFPGNTVVFAQRNPSGVPVHIAVDTTLSPLVFSSFEFVQTP
jgi:hypothetical protein